MNFFFGKFGPENTEQIERKFYAGGPKGSLWYGGIEVGDYVFPIHKGIVSQLWIAKEYKSDFPNRINSEGVLVFEKVNTFGEVAVSTQFLRYKYFSLDLNLVNKSVKSAKSGFFKIALEKEINNLESLDLDQRRDIYITSKNLIDPMNYKERDIRLEIDSENDYSIISIQEFINDKFETYSPLWDLYLKKNVHNERYSLTELLVFSKNDHATKKQSYIEAVLDDLNEKSWFKVMSPVALYDNVIVGRKKTKTKHKQEEDEEIETLDSNEVDADNMGLDHYRKLLDENPNLIFYGPPGTGKTYTAQKLIEYIEHKTSGENKSFEKLISDERIQFITFHQSYSYEEFVEGIRPIFQEEKTEKNGSIQYEIVNGIIKDLAEIAALSQVNENQSIKGKTEISKNSQTYKISLGKRYDESYIYELCKKNNYIAIGWLGEQSLQDLNKSEIFNELKEAYNTDNPTNDASSIDLFVNQINKGDFILVYDSPTTIRDIGIVDSEYYFNDDDENDYHHRRDVKWVKHFDVPFDILNINGGVRLTLKTVYQLNKIQFSDIRELLSEDDDESLNIKELKPCYLIIDEINRGNISKIFGELITLIEKDKRDILSVDLPYSRKPFRFPSNLFIIGTMNTADRSIAIMDTALRRRFTFIELEPNPEVIRISDSAVIEDEIKLDLLLSSLNKKINDEYDRDHRIGHSYFLGIDSFSKFKNLWDYKIIPLLLDYFYNDSKTVVKIVGEGLIHQNTGELNKLQKEEFIKAIKKIYEG